MQRVYIFASSGAGKSTLGRKLSEILHFPHTELDAIFHQSGWQPLDKSEFRQQVSELVETPAWIIDGAYSDVRDLVLQKADTIIFLDYNRARVLFQLLNRTFSRLLFRTELWNGNREEWRNFLSPNPEKNVWIWSMQNFNHRRIQMDQIASDPSIPALTRMRFRSPSETNEWLNSLSQKP